MRKIVLYIATSIDGLIAGKNNDLSWLEEFPNPRQTDYGYQTFYQSIDTLIIGGNTYRAITAMDTPWPYGDKTTYLVSRTIDSDPGTPHVSVLGENWITEVKALKEQKGKDIWIVGGGEVLKQLLEANLIDLMIISQFPVLLGDGVPLFKYPCIGSQWELSRGRYYSNGVVQSEYSLKRSQL